MIWAAERRKSQIPPLRSASRRSAPHRVAPFRSSTLRYALPRGAPHDNEEPFGAPQPNKN